MSRNYELLRQTEQHDRLFASVPEAPPSVSQDWRSDRSREELLKLVQRVFLAPGTGTPRVVVFSAVERGNGCSWVCARTAEILAAHTKERVCLVDGNVRAPGLYRQFGFQVGAVNGGSASADVSVRGSLQNLNGGNLWLMGSRPLCASWGVLLDADRLQGRVAELKADFNYVLVDTAPVNSYADSVLMGRLTDGLVLVLQANATRRQQARKAKDSLEAANVAVLGAVLNRRTFPIPSAFYSRV